MKLFVDTGSIKEIEAVAALGILDGVTTNPSLLAKETGDFRANLKRICDIVKGPVSGEVTATDFAGMMIQGHDIAKIDAHMVVKVPLTRDGIKACKTLSGEGIPVNVTLVFSAAQALLAAKAGAYIISPFVGRLDDIGQNGMDLIRGIATIYKNYGYKTQILTASVRGPMHVIDAATAGSHIATMPLKVLDQMFSHPLTDKGLDQFLKDYAKVFQEAPVAG
jgi:transaldolase